MTRERAGCAGPRPKVCMRRTAWAPELRVEADLPSGRHAESIPELRQLRAGVRGASVCTRS